VGKPALESRDFLKELSLLELTHAKADLPGTLREVEEGLLTARREEPRLTREEVYFLTDLGRVGWGMDRIDTATLAEFRQRSERLAESASLIVIDVGQPDAENLAVTAVRARDTFATLSRAFEIEATVKTFPPRAHSRQPVELLADGHRMTQQTIDIPATGETAVKFACRFESPGDHVLEVRIEGDLLDVDNHRWLSVPVKQAIPVLCIDGRSAVTGAYAATRYLSLALSPTAGAIGSMEEPLVRVEVASEGRLAELPLDRYDCVFLADVAQFTAAEARLLETYAAGGGNLVFFLGDRVQRDRYNAELGGERQGRTRLLPARPGELVDRLENRLNPLDYRHPIVESFRGRERSGLLTVPVGKHVRLTVPEKSKAQVVLALASGDPLIVEEPIGRGRVVLVATSADTSWTYLPLWPSYVPLVQEILHFAIRTQIERQNVLVGEPLTGTLAANVADVSLVVRDPRGRSEPIRANRDSNVNAWTYANTLVSGVYSVGWVSEFSPFLSRSTGEGPGVRADATASLVQPNIPAPRASAFSVNVDPAESDLKQLSIEELRAEVWPGVPFIHQTTWQNTDRPLFGGAGRSSLWSKNLLCGVFVLLLFETFLARRFGHHD